MGFNPNMSYRTIVDLDGDVLLQQNGVWYDKQGHSFATLPPSNAGFAAPYDTFVYSPNGDIIGLQKSDGSTTLLGSIFPSSATYLTKAKLQGNTAGVGFATFASSGNTFQVQTVVESEYDAIQLGIFNSDTNPIAGVASTALAWAAAQADNNVASNYNSATWTDMTWAGGATGTLTANTSGNVAIPSITFSDILALPSIVRTDAGKTLVGLSVRYSLPNPCTGTTVPGPLVPGNAWETDAAAVGNRFYRVRFQGVIAASNATKALLTSTTTSATFWPPILIRYWPRNGAPKTVVLIGDSITSGQGAISASPSPGIAVYRYGFGERMQALYSTPTKPVEVINTGLAGGNEAAMLNMATAMVQGVTNAVYVQPNGTPNQTGATTFTAADVAAMRATKVKIRALLDPLKMNSVTWTILPTDPLKVSGKDWGATDSVRVAMNVAEVAANTFNVADFSKAVSGDTDADGQVTFVQTTDGLHPNDAGHIVLAPVLGAALGIAS